MSIQCEAERRDAIRATRRALDELDAVEYADVYDPHDGDVDGWSLRVCVTVPMTGAIPSDVLGAIAKRGLQTRVQPPRGSHRYLLCHH